MAAVVIAVRKKNKERRRRALEAAGYPAGAGDQVMPAGLGKATGKHADAEEDLVPQWAKACQCWSDFWGKTSLDEAFWKYQPQFRTFYHDTRCELFVAALIFGNFITNVMDKQLNPYADDAQMTRTVNEIEFAFNVAFTIELAINMYGHWFWKFWKSWWNLFDVVVVTVGILQMAGALDGMLANLRLLRAFRVFRLFKRIKSLNKIVTALGRAIPGVLNAFVVVLLVMSIYAILAVEMWCAFGNTPTGEVTMQFASGLPSADITTGRSMKFGDEYFGNFGRAMFSLFEILLEGGSESMARPLMFGQSNVFTAIFYVSFQLINTVVLTNVVVAVLLEKVIEDPEADNVEPPPPPVKKAGESDADFSRRSSVAKKHQRKSLTSKRVEPEPGAGTGRDVSAAIDKISADAVEEIRASRDMDAGGDVAAELAAMRADIATIMETLRRLEARKL